MKTGKIEQTINLLECVDSITQGDHEFYGPGLDKIIKEARAEFAALKESEKRAIRLCGTIWHRQWSNPEDCLMDAINLMKMLDPEHPMAKVRTLREETAAKKDSYIAIRKENERLRETLLPFALIAEELDKHEKLSREDLLCPIWQFGDCILSVGAFIGVLDEGGDDGKA